MPTMDDMTNTPNQRVRLLAAFAGVRNATEEWAVGGPDFGRERALVLTKLDEAELWLTRCAMKDER
jgi:hypothetical protein